MAHANGTRLTAQHAFALLLLLILPLRLQCQNGILDSVYSFKDGNVKTAHALSLITKKTGYSFTYDSRLINTEKKTNLTFSDEKLGVILLSVVGSDSLTFSVIDRYIIISKKISPDKADGKSIISGYTGYISGSVADNETKEPLPFATLALKKSGRGTISNGNGEFGLKISPDILSDTLLITYLGYQKREIPVQQFPGNNFTIEMAKEFISIPEIIIRNQVPSEIIIKTRKAIPENYGTTPSVMTGFYREGVLKKSELQIYSEAVVKIYKSAYSNTLQGDQLSILKSRKIENLNISDTLAIRLKAGLSTCLELDGVKNTFDFIMAESMNDYSYRLTDIVTYEDESAYVIEFEQHKRIEEPLYRGTIYINASDYAILHAEFELNPENISKMKESFIARSTHGFVTWPLTVKYNVDYRKLNGRYFLSHVRGDLLFTSNKKRKLFKSQFKVFFELAITDINTTRAERFEKEELAPIHSVFSKTITSYDPAFWGNQDFLRPEDNLLQALKNMNVKMQEFTEEK